MIENFFFVDELSSDLESEKEVKSNSNVGNCIFGPKLDAVPNGEQNVQKNDFGSLNALKNSLMITQNMNKPARDRIMSEAVPLNPNRERNVSIFDMLINSRRSS